MTHRLLLTILGAVAFALLAAVPASASIPIYSNDLASNNGRSQLVKHDGDACRRGGTKAALRITLGARTRACSYSAPVVGRELDIVATGRLLSGTPAKLRARSYVAVGLRAGEGGSIRALVFPAQKKLQLIQQSPEGQVRFLAVAKREQAIRGVNQANRVFLRAVNQGEPGHCRVVVRVNGRRVAVTDVKQCAQLTGRDTIIETGATRGGEGVTASFAKLTVSVPNPFAG